MHFQTHQGHPRQGDPQVIYCLQAQLKNELTAINQYFVDHRMFKHWGFDKTAGKEYEKSIGEMKHALDLVGKVGEQNYLQTQMGG